MRVLHLRNSDLLGGPERLILDQAALAAADVQITIASFVAPGAAHAFLDAAAPVACVRRVDQRSAYDPRLARRVAHLVAEVDPDVVVCHDYKANALALLAARGRPKIAVVHGYTAEGAKVGMFEAIDRRLLRRMDAVVVVSPVLREQVLARGVEAARVHEIPNGIRPERVRAAAQAGRKILRAAWGIRAEEPLVLALGRLSPEKGQDVLLEAFAALPPALRARLVLVGDGASRAALETRAGAEDLRARGVCFAGWREDPWACLGAADLFVLPSRREGVPLALLEALAAGKPTVATRVGAVPAVLDEGRCGLVVPPDDADALCTAMTQLLTERARAEALGVAGRARVDRSFDARRQTQRLEALYRAVACARTVAS